MSVDTTLGSMTELLKPWTVLSRPVSDTRLEVETTAENIVPAVGALKGAQWGFLSAITGLDHGAAVKADSGAAASGAAPPSRQSPPAMAAASKCSITSAADPRSSPSG